LTNINAINININKNGKMTKNHETEVYPSLQIIFKIHVQKRTYSIFKEYNILILETLHVYLPTQYEFGLPRFCNAITINVIIEITKYTCAGVHSLYSPGIFAIV